MLSARKRGSPTTVAKYGNPDIGQCGGRMDETKKRCSYDIDTEGGGEHQICSFMWADNFWIMSHSKKHLEQMLKDLIEEAAEVDLEPKPASLWWTSTYASEDMEDMILGTLKGLPLGRRIQDTGMDDESLRENMRRCGRKNAVDEQVLLEGHQDTQE